MTMIKEKLNKIRAPRPLPGKKAATATLGIFALGVALGLFSKWLDNLAFDGTTWWLRLIETLDLGNFFSAIAIWLLSALVIAVLSASAVRAGLNVLVFFAGACVAYHIYTIAFSGFNPSSYMLFWYGVTLLSPFLAALCWYAKGTGLLSILLDIGIFAVFSLACFSMGVFYVDLKGVLYVLTFVGAAVALYRSPKHLLISLLVGFLLALLLSPFWPYR